MSFHIFKIFHISKWFNKQWTTKITTPEEWLSQIFPALHSEHVKGRLPTDEYINTDFWKGPSTYESEEATGISNQAGVCTKQCLTYTLSTQHPGEKLSLFNILWQYSKMCQHCLCSTRVRVTAFQYSNLKRSL